MISTVRPQNTLCEYPCVVDRWQYFETREFVRTNDGWTITRLDTFGSAAYGAAEISSGSCEWRVRIDCVSVNIYIGVAHTRGQPYFFTKGCGYAYIPVSACTSMSLSKCHLPPPVSFLRRYPCVSVL